MENKELYLKVIETIQESEELEFAVTDLKLDFFKDDIDEIETNKLSDDQLMGNFMAILLNRAYEAGHDAGYEEGYDAGYEEGHDIGYKEGHDIGYDEGRDIGYDDGYSEGYDDGHKMGYQQALEEVQ